MCLLNRALVDTPWPPGRGKCFLGMARDCYECHSRHASAVDLHRHCAPPKHVLTCPLCPWVKPCHPNAQPTLHAAALLLAPRCQTPTVTPRRATTATAMRPLAVPATTRTAPLATTLTTSPLCWLCVASCAPAAGCCACEGAGLLIVRLASCLTRAPHGESVSDWLSRAGGDLPAHAVSAHQRPELSKSCVQRVVLRHGTLCIPHLAPSFCVGARLRPYTLWSERWLKLSAGAAHKRTLTRPLMMGLASLLTST